jgi:hypothetical protein
MEKGLPPTVTRWLQVITRHRLVMAYSILLITCVLSIVPVLIYFYGRVFPWWADGGIWLKQVNAIFGREYPMWGKEPLQFDQVYFLSLASLSLLLRDNLLALKTSALLVSAIRPASTFILARKIFRSEVAGLAAALLSGLHPLFYETMGWGGYPNLLGYALLPLSFYVILRSIEKASPRNVLFTGLIVAATAFSHNLTFIVFLGVLGLWLLLILVMKVLSKPADMRRQLAMVAYSIGVMLSVLVVELFVTGLPAYDYSNEAAFYRLRIGLVDLFWAVKNSTIAFSLIFLTVTSFILVGLIRGRGSRPYILAMVSWILAPLLMTQAYLLGITIDYRRVFFFTVQPSLILATAPLAMLGGLISKVKAVGAVPHGISTTRRVRKAAKALPSIILILLSLSLLATEVSIGLSYSKVVDDWYTHTDLYGDKDKLEALEWINHNTAEDAVFVAEEPFARWIEGLASRRVLMYAPPQYLFVEGEKERSEAARTVLEGRFELRNGLVKICDQDPYGNFTPSISFKREGVYEDTMYVNGKESKIYLSNGTAVWYEQISEDSSNRSYSLCNRSTTALYKVRYSLGYLSFERQIRLNGNDGDASIVYSVWTRDSGLTLLNLTIPVFSAEGRGFDEVYAESTDRIRVRSGPLWFHISMKGEILKAVSINFQGKDTIILSFKPQPNPPRSISAAITIRADLPRTKFAGAIAIDRDDTIKEFNISYIAVPRLSKVQPGGVIPLKLQTLAIYTHMLEDPAFKVVFENSKVIILRVNSSG